MGVGKSTAGWLVYRRLAVAAFVDTDQLGLCYPAAEDDPQNHRMKARNLAGLQFPPAPIVVAGGVDSAGTWQIYRDALGSRPVTMCRLRVDAVELRARIEARGGPLAALADEAVEMAAALDGTDFSDITINTSGRSAGDVAELVLERMKATVR